jgi:RNA polymerase sigma factor (TIGR02999 family)
VATESERSLRTITGLLARWEDGDQAALEGLMSLVYGQLRAIAAKRLPSADGTATLGTTALVHETFLRLRAQERVHWENRAHFFAIAARLARRVIIDHVRRRMAAKRDIGEHGIELNAVLELSATPIDWLDLDEALDSLREVDPLAEKIVLCRFFGGMSSREIAEAHEISESTVARRWRFARAFLERRLRARSARAPRRSDGSTASAPARRAPDAALPRRAAPPAPAATARSLPRRPLPRPAAARSLP